MLKMVVFPTKFILPTFPASCRCLMIVFQVGVLGVKWMYEGLGIPCYCDTPSTSHQVRKPQDTPSRVLFLVQEVLDCHEIGFQVFSRHPRPLKTLSLPRMHVDQHNWSTPTVSNNLATSTAELGTFGAVFLSCRAIERDKTLIFGRSPPHGRPSIKAQPNFQ